jgi:hypothetical protein
MQHHLAQAQTNLGQPVTGIGPLGQLPQIQDAFNQFNNILTLAVGVITVIAAIWFLFVLITGAIGIMTAGGNKGAIEENRQKIFTGIIGLIIIIAALFIADIVGTIFGINILNPGGILQTLTP